MKRALLICVVILTVLAGAAFAVPYSHYALNSNPYKAGAEHNYSGKRMGLEFGNSPENINIYRPATGPEYDSPQNPPDGKNVVPEPGTILLLGLGALGLALKGKLTK